MAKKLTHPKDITLIRVYTSAFQTSPWLFKSTFYRQEKWTQWRLHGQQGWERFEYHSTHSLCFTICFLGLLLHMTWACFLFFCCLHFCLQSNFRTRMKKNDPLVPLWPSAMILPRPPSGSLSASDLSCFLLLPCYKSLALQYHYYCIREVPFPINKL